MKRKIIAAALVLMSAGLAWHAFADPEDTYDWCIKDCSAKYTVCSEDLVDKGEWDVEKILHYCLVRKEQCETKCKEKE
jgi:hypothetical protein